MLYTDNRDNNLIFTDHCFSNLKAQYGAAVQMSSPSADSYAYYPMGYQPQAAYFDSTPWSTSGTDPLSYLSGYNQQTMGAADFMQFPTFDYSSLWPGYAAAADYWGSPQQSDPKLLDGQTYMTAPMDQVYSDAYNSSGALQKTLTNNQGMPVVNNEAGDVKDLEQSMHTMSVNGHSNGSQSSPSETLLQDPNVANVNNSSVITSANSATPSPAKSSWANVAKTPAKPTKILTRLQPSKTTQEANWDKGASRSGQPSQGQRAGAWSAPRNQRNGSSTANSDRSANPRQQHADKHDSAMDPTLNKLKSSNAYNPKAFDLTAKNARFFVIKSYSEDDIHRAIKYGVWCSTEHGNKRLDSAYKEREGKGPVYLFYSVNGSGHFCGMAQMMSGVDYKTNMSVWTQDKWKGSMVIKWIYVKDVPNGHLRYIRLSNNENKPVTNSRDTQEVLPEQGREVLKVIHNYRHSTSIFDDFGHYEKKEVEETDSDRKKPLPKMAVSNL